MIDTLYAVNCLKQGFQRYIRYTKINATIDCGDNYVSFYVKDFNSTGKQFLARSSNHHLRMQHIADKDEPWKGDNISIVFITPNSSQDSRIRKRVNQNIHGSIKPFSVTTYQYDNMILDKKDLSQIFHTIISFLNGNGYTDPFANTPKAAKVIPLTANIKPYKEKHPARNISIDKDGNYVSANSWGADFVSESRMHNIIRETIEDFINEESMDGLLNIINEYLNDVNEYVQPFGLTVSFNNDYPFRGYSAEFLAVYQTGSVARKNIRIGINLPYLKTCMINNGIPLENLKEQINISIWHEVGHGLVEFIKNLRRSATRNGSDLFTREMREDFKYIIKYEEEMVEMFGAMQEGYVRYSDLDDFITRYEENLVGILSLRSS